MQTVAYPDVLHVALCFGWIDGIRRRFDDVYFLQTYTPRRKRSKWSQVNRDKVEALIASGDMHAAGLAEVERAKADGRWDAAYEAQSKATVPDDLQAELDRHPRARRCSRRSSSQNRYSILFRIRDGQEARDAGAPDRQVRDDARRGRDDLPAVGGGPSGGGARRRTTRRRRPRTRSWIRGRCSPKKSSPRARRASGAGLLEDRLEVVVDRVGRDRRAAAPPAARSRRAARAEPPPARAASGRTP